MAAKSKDYLVRLPDGTLVPLTEGTGITHIEIIAGKGRNRAIDEIYELLGYGGSEYEWTKKKGLGYLDYKGESYKAEIHWYEEPTVGRVELKAKQQTDGSWILDD
jgi:hypothetical protein